jgi:hypothetical protein
MVFCLHVREQTALLVPHCQTCCYPDSVRALRVTCARDRTLPVSLQGGRALVRCKLDVVSSLHLRLSTEAMHACCHWRLLVALRYADNARCSASASRVLEAHGLGIMHVWCATGGATALGACRMMQRSRERYT